MLFPDGTKVWFVVIRNYSHTDRQQLVKVVSRPMASWMDADLWKRVKEKEDNWKHDFAVIAVPEGQKVLPV